MVQFSYWEVHRVPIYEYECGRCRKRFDLKQRFDDEPVGICPICAGKAHRVFHSVPIFFKGSGFYCTDHGRSGSNSSISVPKDKTEETVASEVAKNEGENKATVSAGEQKQSS